MAVVGIAVLFITAAFIVGTMADWVLNDVGQDGVKNVWNPNAQRSVMRLHVTQSSCSVSYIATCHRSVENYYFNTPTNDSDYSAFCSQVSSTCSSTLSDCSCTTPLTNDQYSCLDYIGLKNAIASVCNSADDRRVFINNRPCIVAYVDSKVSTCRAKNTEDCTGYNATFKCFYNAMLASCNKETAEMMTRFELKRYKPLLDSISCTIVTSDYMPSSAALRGTVFGSTVPAALLFIAVMY